MYHMAVVRKFEAFDQATINEEFLALTRADFRDLTHAMAQFQRGEESGYAVKNYGDGLMIDQGKPPGPVSLVQYRADRGRNSSPNCFAYLQEGNNARPRPHLANSP